MVKRKCAKSTITEIAKRAKVSVATVSRAFSGHPYVKDELRGKIFKLARELDYTPKASGSREQSTIGVIINASKRKKLSMGIFESTMLKELINEIYYRNLNLEIITEVNHCDLEKKFIKAAIILGEHKEEAGSFCSKWPGTSFITVNNYIEGCYLVASDHKDSARQAIEYLISKGHKKIGFLGSLLESWGVKQRFEGYKEALAENSIKSSRDYVKFTNGSEAVESILKIARFSPSAILVCGENMSARANYALYLAGNKVPDDISIITYEDSNVSKYIFPPNTTMCQDFAHLASLAVDRAVEIINGNPSDDKNIFIKDQLIERESVKDLTF